MCRSIILCIAASLAVAETAHAQAIMGKGVLVEMSQVTQSNMMIERLVVDMTAGRTTVDLTGSTKINVFKDLPVEAFPVGTEVILQGSLEERTGSLTNWCMDWQVEGYPNRGTASRRETNGGGRWSLTARCKIVGQNPSRAEVLAENDFYAVDAAGTRQANPPVKPVGAVITLDPRAAARQGIYPQEHPHRKILGTTVNVLKQMSGKQARIWVSAVPGSPLKALTVTTRRMEPLPP